MDRKLPVTIALVAVLEVLAAQINLVWAAAGASMRFPLWSTALHVLLAVLSLVTFFCAYACIDGRRLHGASLIAVTLGCIQSLTNAIWSWYANGRHAELQYVVGHEYLMLLAATSGLLSLCLIMRPRFPWDRWDPWDRGAT